MLLLLHNSSGQALLVGSEQIEQVTLYSGTANEEAIEKHWSTVRLVSGRELLVRETIDDILALCSHIFNSCGIAP